jgi:putative ABC transport system permease protein
VSMPAEVKIYLPGWDRMRVNGHAIVYTALLAGTSGIVAGLAAAFAGLRGDVTVALKEGGRSAVGSGRHRLRSALVLCQVVLALVLLVGAGLMVKGFGGLSDPIPNGAPERVLTMHVELPETKYPDRVRRVAFVQHALSELSALRGAESVAIGSTLPYSGYGSGSDFEIEGRPSLSPAERPHTRTLSVSDRYLSTLRVSFVRGRDFRTSDDEKGQPVAIVSEAIVRRYFPNQDPIGRRIQIGSGKDVPWTTIVGVVKDVLYDWVTPSSALMIYRPYAQVSRASVSVAIRTTGDPLRLASAARAAIRGVDPDQPVSQVMTFRKLIDDYLIGLAYVAWMMGVFGFVALTLSVIGLYSMLTYDVAERTREIGVRMALGARRMDVLRLVLVRGLALTGAGLVLGLVASLWVTRSLASLFYGVQAYDTAAIGGVMLLLAATASIACLVPAHRATQVDPLQSLRNE